jgi:hypothetical protein
VIQDNMNTCFSRFFGLKRTHALEGAAAYSPLLLFKALIPLDDLCALFDLLLVEQVMYKVGIIVIGLVLGPYGFSVYLFCLCRFLGLFPVA